MMSLNHQQSNNTLHKPYPINSSTRKRTHLKPSQVAVLQESFVTNTLPDASMRAQLAQDLGVTERTVQIWFQNRRAKARKLEANSGLPTSLVPNVRTGWIDMPQITQQTQQQHTTTFRSFVEPQTENEPNIKRRPRSTSKPEKISNNATFAVPTPPQRAMSEGMGRITGVLAAATHAETKDKQHLVYFPVNTIRIGSWARFASQISADEWDLVCFSDTNTRQLIWQVQDDGHQFRIEISHDNIRQIRLGQIQVNIDQFEIDVEPCSCTFSMRRHGIDQDWIRCGDFTESQQATEGLSHALQGSHDALRQSLLELVSCAPQLASKLVIIPDHDFLVRDLTISPSATPEPSIAHYLHDDHHHLFMDNKSPWQQQSTSSPYYPPPSSQSYDHATNSSWTYLNMLQQQQNNQQQQQYLTSHNNNVMNSFL